MLNSRVVILLMVMFAARRTAEAAPALLVVRHAWILNPTRTGIQMYHGYLEVGRDGRISAIGPGEPAPGTASDADFDARGQFVAPGFVSAHSHLFTSPFRGVGTTETLYGWGKVLRTYYNQMTADDVYWCTLHGSVDFLRNGITTAYDFTFSGSDGGVSIGRNDPIVPLRLRPGPFEENQIRAKADAGLRFIDSVSLVEVGDHAEILARLGRLIDYANRNFGTNPLFLKMAISGGVQRAPSPATAFLEVEAMRRYHLINQVHFLESPERVQEQQAKFDWYVQAGALGPDLIFAHFIHVTDAIVRTAAASGSSMCWQPSSNSRLGSGVADIVKYRSLGMKIGVGLDDQTCTDISDPFQNMRIGLALMRTKYERASALSVEDMFYLHTLGSADILGIADRVGSLEVGKYADFLVVDPRAPDTGPVHDPIGTYVYACGLRNLKRVYVGGRLAAEGTRILTFDEGVLRREIDRRVARICQAGHAP